MSRVHQAVLDTLLARQRKAEVLPDVIEPKPKPSALIAKKDNIQSDSLKTAALELDSLTRQQNNLDSIRRKLKKPFLMQDRERSDLRKRENNR